MRLQLRGLYLRIDDGYTPRPFGGSVTLFWPDEDPVSPGEAAKRWGHVAQRVDTHVIPGTHFTCLTDHARSAAEELKRCLG